MVDLTGLHLDDDILDMGYEGKGVIYRALKNNSTNDVCDETAVTADNLSESLVCDWVYGRPEKLPFENCSYKTAAAFFSLSFIKRKSQRNKTIKEVARVLKKNGKLFIWDININTFCFHKKTDIKAIIPGGQIIKQSITQTGYPGSFSIKSLLPALERYFIINEKRDSEKHFYVEAIKRDDID